MEVQSYGESLSNGSKGSALQDSQIASKNTSALITRKVSKTRQSFHNLHVLKHIAPPPPGPRPYVRRRPSQPTAAPARHTAAEREGNNLKGVEHVCLNAWPKPRPYPGRDCLIRADFARQRGERTTRPKVVLSPTPHPFPHPSPRRRPSQARSHLLAAPSARASLSLSHTHTLSLSLPHTHTHTLSLSLSHTHTHTPVEEVGSERGAPPPAVPVEAAAVPPSACAAPARTIRLLQG